MMILTNFAFVAMLIVVAIPFYSVVKEEWKKSSWSEMSHTQILFVLVLSSIIFFLLGVWL